MIRGDARRLPLADDTVDLVVTSPPYFALRSYEDAGEHYVGQIGSEPTPQEFLDALLEVTAECVRVLKPSGSMWVNLGDKYSDRAGPAWAGSSDRLTGRPSKPRRASSTSTLQPSYFSAVDEIREEHARTWGPNNGGTRPALAGAGSQYDGLDQSVPNPLGKLPGSVWEVATEPLKVPAELGINHFAAFPTEWPKRIISGWAPAGVCTTCGEGRRPSTVAVRHRKGEPVTAAIFGKTGKHSTATGRQHSEQTDRTIVGYTCACPDTSAPATPGVVLDPFGGTGTTAMVAKALGRDGISVDMSADYCRLAEWRTNDRDQLAKVLGIAKADAQPADQLDLLSALASLEGVTA